MWVICAFSLKETENKFLLYSVYKLNTTFTSLKHRLWELQGGARNVIPLIVYVTHFYYYKNLWHLVQN